MPVQVYLRYYSLDFLKSFDPSYVNYAGRIANAGAKIDLARPRLPSRAHANNYRTGDSLPGFFII